MCGIAGYTGSGVAKNFVLKTLKKLDYRGYDSAGVSFFENNALKVVKVVGRVEQLEQKLKKSVVDASVMIGHTRWATHGKVDLKNAHPQQSNNQKISVVHNGIIENFDVLKQKLQKNLWKVMKLWRMKLKLLV